MKIHELKTLNFSEALGRLEETAIMKKGEIGELKSRAEKTKEARELE